MKPRHFLTAVLALCALGVAACGNKGPLVRPSDVPPPAADTVAPPPAQDDGG